MAGASTTRERPAMADPVPSLARRIRRLREAAGMTQQALAVAAGLSISAVTKLEQGQNEDPRVSTLLALAQALGVRVDDLLGDRADAEATPKRTTRRKQR
jgi:transcriptional regulator with XRE-family HTH domain